MLNIFKQVSWLFFSQILTRLIGFVYTIYLARSLGVLNFGLYSLALAYFSIISSISDFGFNRFLIREIVAVSGKKWEIIWNVLIVRLTLVSICFALFTIGMYLFDFDKLRVSVILLASLAVLPQAISVTFDGIFVALQKLQYSAMTALILSLSIVVVGFTFLSWGWGIYGAVSAFVVSQFIYVFAAAVILLYLGRVNFSQVKGLLIKKIIYGSIPYGILSILGLLYFRIDTIILSYLRGTFETGIYAAGYKFLESLLFIPNALTFALFPTFAKLHQTNFSKIKTLIVKVSIIMFILGMLITGIYLVMLPLIIHVLLPKFSSSILVVQILSLAIPFMFVHIPASAVLTSSEKYLKQIILFSLFPLAVNILANVLFIPDFGYLAAAWITVISDIISAVILLIFIRTAFKNG